ncbi:MAG TPA: pyruvate/oxaloacetate carboxyltransferase [Bacillota bacterium]|nr:pyruvate/oxaloacetate carboxyltransferase [Bacillota bacterium]HOK65061.1 pyruvate/oxaloacetate carboxyltransferase [Bacillota bacterium]HOL12391.1 pyruvate/oxaloacetate carboxyltransferase [Bacillota bacterium]HPP61044.1 pyruvate/oxaloacetate carboxyltransferase [Bacillota bacterium]HPZ78800.1 pyruvate/oxaloacetate carboxyltransferase [Bacillota bacterium]
MTGTGVTRRVGITDTTLRDAHQSLLATRMRTDDMVPILDKMDQVGFYSVECWGGATFDTCLRFLGEDPWDRLRTLRKGFKNTRLLMLLRGQNLLGYRHYPDDVVEAFVRAAVKNGIDIMRIFDALNDTRNMEKAIEVSKEVGAHVQATVCYTISPVHDIEYYARIARDLQDMGADSLCLKDMAGILGPKDAYEIVKRWKDETGLPVEVHSHYTSGMASMAYLKAIEAGADAINCAISSLSMSTSQPAGDTFVAALKDTQYDTGLDLALMSEIAEHFKGVRAKYAEFDKASPVPDPNVLRYQIPGGMISNFINQLREQGQIEKLPQVLEEVPRVRADMGYPPLVTPTSQIVGTQAVFNVLTGERYKVVTNEVKDYFRGLYGRPPAPVNEEVKRLVIGDEEPITDRPANHLEPGMEKAKKELGHLYTQPEDVISYAVFPQQTKKFLQEKLARQTKVDYELLEQAEKDHPIGYLPI